MLEAGTSGFVGRRLRLPGPAGVTGAVPRIQRAVVLFSRDLWLHRPQRPNRVTNGRNRDAPFGGLPGKLRPPGQTRIGVSSCLLGEPVGFGGGHSRCRFLTDELGSQVDWVPFCPEIAIGLGSPRETLRLTFALLTMPGCRAA